MSELETELLFVDDGSTDRTLRVMKDLHILDARCQFLSFSRNFGKEAAIYAGLRNATGDYVAVMDVDLQDPPHMLPQMYKILEQEGYDSVATKRSTRTGEPRIRSFLSESFYKFINKISHMLPQMYKILEQEGYDSVATKRSTRTGEPRIRSFLSESFYKFINKISKTEIVNGARDYRLMKRNMVDAVSTRTGEPRIRSFLSESFYKFINKISKTEIVNGARDYRLMKRNMVDAVLNMSEYNRFSKGIFEWVGFRTKWLEFENVDINKISKTEIVNGARDYRLMKRNMVDAVLNMSEYNRFSKGIFEWVGFRTKWLEFENVERSAGTTKWSLKKLFFYYFSILWKELQAFQWYHCLWHLSWE